MKNKTPLISVILPAYNAEEHIYNAAQSILRQSCSDFELIIINDGSEDNSEKIIDDIKDTRVIKIYHKKNQGLISTLNEGIDISKGKFIARMDSDDISLPQRFNHQINYMNRNPEVGICSTWFKIKYTKSYSYKKEETNPEKVKCKLLFSCPIAHPAVLLRKNILMQRRDYYSMDFPHAEDYELWTRLCEITKISNVPRVLFEYRVSEEQVSNKHKDIQRKSIIKAQKILLSKINLVPDESESRINEAIFFQEFEYSTAFALSAENWLLKISQNNNKTDFFSQQALEDIIFQMWYMICSELAGKGVKTKDLFFESKLFLKELLSASHIIKINLKSIFN